jgi:hypothetical protein
VLRISDPKPATKERGELKKKTFYPKFVIKLSKIWVLGSKIRKKPIPDPGSRSATLT